MKTIGMFQREAIQVMARVLNVDVPALNKQQRNRAGFDKHGNKQTYFDAKISRDEHREHIFHALRSNIVMASRTHERFWADNTPEGFAKRQEFYRNRDERYRKMIEDRKNPNK